MARQKLKGNNLEERLEETRRRYPIDNEVEQDERADERQRDDHAKADEIENAAITAFEADPTPENAKTLREERERAAEMRALADTARAQTSKARAKAEQHQRAEVQAAVRQWYVGPFVPQRLGSTIDELVSIELRRGELTRQLAREDDEARTWGEKIGERFPKVSAQVLALATERIDADPERQAAKSCLPYRAELAAIDAYLATDRQRTIDAVSLADPLARQNLGPSIPSEISEYQAGRRLRASLSRGALQVLEQREAHTRALAAERARVAAEYDAVPRAERIEQLRIVVPTAPDCEEPADLDSWTAVLGAPQVSVRFLPPEPPRPVAPSRRPDTILHELNVSNS